MIRFTETELLLQNCQTDPRFLAQNCSLTLFTSVNERALHVCFLQQEEAPLSEKNALKRSKQPTRHLTADTQRFNH